ncbi:MAG: hypothetical protein AAF799_14040 [Myxococcota bacterium]
MHQSPVRLGILLSSTLVALAASGCKNPEIKAGNRAQRTVKANVASFDPNADVVLDLDKYGSERPDEYATQMAFNQAFEPMDECVLSAKERKKMQPESVLHDGMMDFAVKLEGKSGKAAAVNATLPGKLDNDGKLKDCVRNAVAGVQFPSYDGPPVVVEFSTEVDPGYMEE